MRIFADTQSQNEFNTVLQGVRAAKTTKAAAAFAPQVTAAKTAFKQAEKSLDSELSRHREADRSYTAARTKYELFVETKEPGEVAAAKAEMDRAWTKVQTAQTNIDTLTAARTDAQAKWDDLTTQHADIKAGQVQAPAAGTQAPAQPAPAAPVQPAQAAPVVAPVAAPGQPAPAPADAYAAEAFVAPTIPASEAATRTSVQNADGTTSTVRTINVGTDKGTVQIPTVINGRVVSVEEAVAEYRKTGRHFGIYPTIEAANAAGKALHESEEARGTQQAPARPLAQEGNIVTNPQTGQRLVLRNGQWVPVQ